MITWGTMTRTPRRPAASPRVRVALVDDHQLMLDGLKARLSKPRTGVDVSVAATSWGELVSSDEFPTEVVVLDLNLDDDIPVGVKIRALAAAGSRTVVISRHADAASIRGAIQAGATAFVPKSDSADELIESIHAAAINRNRYSETVQSALAEAALAKDPRLGRQEQRAMVLYAAGRSIREVATDMETTQETVKSYIKRARRKHLAVGVDVGTKLLLRRHAIRQGWIAPD